MSVAGSRAGSVASLRSFGNVQKTVPSSGSWATARSGPPFVPRLGERALVDALAAPVGERPARDDPRRAVDLDLVDDAQALADLVLRAPARVAVDRRPGRRGPSRRERRSAICLASSSTSRPGTRGSGASSGVRTAAALTGRPPARRSSRGPRPSRPSTGPPPTPAARTRTGPSAPRRIHPAVARQRSGPRSSGKPASDQQSVSAKRSPVTSSVAPSPSRRSATSGTPAPSASGRTSVVKVASAAPSATTRHDRGGVLDAVVGRDPAVLDRPAPRRRSTHEREARRADDGGAVAGARPSRGPRPRARGGSAGRSGAAVRAASRSSTTQYSSATNATRRAWTAS